MIERTTIGWSDENGVVAFDKEHAFLNTFRHPEHRTPIWKDVNCVTPVTEEGQ